MKHKYAHAKSYTFCRSCQIKQQSTMTALKDSTRYIGNSLNILSRLVDSDTDVSTIDLNIIENLNTNQSLNYIKLEQNLNNLESNANSLEELSKYRSTRLRN